MKLRFKLIFKQGLREVAVIEGPKDVSTSDISIKEVTQSIPETEAFLERLTGLRVHIESRTVGEDAEW